MNKRLSRGMDLLVKQLVHFYGALAAIAVTSGAFGCASKKPAPVSVEHPVALSGQAYADNDLRLKLVTYNIWGLPGWMTGAHSGRYPKIARELDRLNPDLILLQEAWTAKARRSVPAYGPWSVARAAGQRTFFQQSGLVTLSKFPIIGGRFYPFSRSAFPDRFVNKGALKITVQLPTREVLNIWNVHLQDGGSPEIRLSQIRELIARVQSAEDGQVADLIGGDFNCTPDSPLYQELSNSLGQSVQQLSGAAPFVTWDGLSSKPGMGQTLDYIFVRCQAGAEELKAEPRAAFAAADLDKRLSDHLGIEAVVDLGMGPAAARVIHVSSQDSQLHASALKTMYADEQ
jgi:endonuclease/exonuclease/phosphatase family metal-dependent hydrolase